MSKKCNLAVIMAVGILISFILTAPLVVGASSEEPLYQRRNIFGMHNLKDGGPSIASGMEATRLLGGSGFVFDWVFDFEPWIEEAFKRNLIPCIRVQNGRDGSLPDPGYAGKVSRGIYFVDSFAGHNGCSGCDLFADFLGQQYNRSQPPMGRGIDH